MKFGIRKHLDEPIEQIIKLTKKAVADDNFEDDLYAMVGFFLEHRLEDVIYEAVSELAGKEKEKEKELLQEALVTATYGPDDILFDIKNPQKRVVFEAFTIPFGLMPSENAHFPDYYEISAEKVKEIFLKYYKIEKNMTVIFDNRLYHPADLADSPVSDYRLYMKGCADQLVAGSSQIVPPLLKMGKNLDETVIPRVIIGLMVGFESAEKPIADILYNPKVIKKTEEFTEEVLKTISSDMPGENLAAISLGSMTPLSLSGECCAIDIRSVGLMVALRETLREYGGVLVPRLEVAPDGEETNERLQFRVKIRDGEDLIFDHKVVQYRSSETEEEFFESVQAALEQGRLESGATYGKEISSGGAGKGKLLMFPVAAGNA